MKCTFCSAALLSCILLSPLAAEADTMDQFTFTTPTNTLSFQLPDTLIAPQADGSIVYSSIATTLDAVPSTDSITFWPKGSFGGGFSTTIFDVAGDQLFGDTSFILGTFMFDSTASGTYDSTLLVSAVPTPEPSSLLLLGTGLVGIATAVRGRTKLNWAKRLSRP